jgi:hypothetical protein
MRVCRYLLLTALVAAPVAAEPLGRFAACMVGEVPRAERLTIAEIANSATPVPPAMTASFLAHSDVCARRLSVRGTGLTYGHAEFIGAISIEYLAPRLTEAGLPVDAIDAWYDRQSEATRLDPIPPLNGSGNEAPGLRLLDALAAHEVHIPLSPEHYNLVGSYLFAKETLTRRGRAFTLPPAE